MGINAVSYTHLVSIIEANLKENIGEVVIKVNEQNENDINLSV